jgi:RNA-directed DNA polymerase
MDRFELMQCVARRIVDRQMLLNRMWKGWRQTKRGEQFPAQMVTYADDFVILSRGKANEALEWTRGVLRRLGLRLNEKKTSIRNARQERFDFLGYTFGPHINPRGGGRYLGHSPSKKSVGRIKRKVGETSPLGRKCVKS